MSQVALFKKDDRKKWEWFWKVFYNHKEKLKLLEWLLHWQSYEDKNEFDRRIDLLHKTREKSIYVDFDSKSNVFLTPYEIFSSQVNIEEIAKIELNYARKVFYLITSMVGPPTPDTILKVYQFQRRQAEADKEEQKYHSSFKEEQEIEHHKCKLFKIEK